MYVNFTGLRDVQINSEPLLSVSVVRMFLKEISLWLCQLSKDHPHERTEHHWICWGPKQNKKAKEGQILSLCLSSNTHLLLPRVLENLALELLYSDQDLCHKHLNFRLSDSGWIIPVTFLDSLACRWQIVGLCLFHEYASQLLYKKFPFLHYPYLNTSYWFCFSG